MMRHGSILLVLLCSGPYYKVYFCWNALYITSGIFIHVCYPFHAEYFKYLLLPNVYNLQNFSCKHVFSIRVENSVDPDQLAS